MEVHKKRSKLKEEERERRVEAGEGRKENEDKAPRM